MEDAPVLGAAVPNRCRDNPLQERLGARKIEDMRRPKRPKALLISLGIYLAFFAASVNAPDQNAQAIESFDEEQLYVYLLGRIAHIGVGLDVLDASGQPVSVRVWDFGSRNHYKHKDEEWVTGERNWFGSLNNVSLLFGTTEGEMRAWDPTKRFNMTLEEFKRSSKVKVRLPVTRAQWGRINDWLHARTAAFDAHASYDELGLDIWYGGGVDYNLFSYNCATFIGDALFAGGVYTADNVPSAPGRLAPVSSRWLFPPSVIAHYRQHPLLTAEQVRSKALAYQQRHACVDLQRAVGGGFLGGLSRKACTLS